MDAGVFRLNHGSDVYVVRSCCNEDGADLLALGGEHSVEVFQIVSRILVSAPPSCGQTHRSRIPHH